MRMQELPVDVNVDVMASRFLELFTPDERTILRFGMLPADKMEMLQKQVRSVLCDKLHISGKSEGNCVLWLEPGDTQGELVEFRLSRLVNEVVHEISVALYRQGELVV